MTDRELYPSTADLAIAKEISVRTCNCCRRFGLESLYDILLYYEQGESFEHIEGAGSKTFLELQWLCRTLMPPIPNRTLPGLEEEIAQDSDAEMIERFNALFLDESKRKTIEKKYEQIIQTYSVRARTWLERIPLATLVSRYLVCPDNKSSGVEHFFIKNMREAIDLKEKLQTEITRQFNMSKEEYLKEEIFNRYRLTGSAEYPVSYYLKYGHFPMFWILEKQLENDDDRDVNAMKETFRVYRNQKPLSLNEFAVKYSISRERVRQIRKEAFEELFLRKSAFFQDKNWQCYEPWSRDAIWEEDMQYYINDEQCGFSEEFILQILLTVLYRNGYTLYGGINSRHIKNGWHSTFLVRDELAEIFDFDKFRREFNALQLGNKSEYLQDIQTLVANCSCWKKSVPEATAGIADIVRDILRFEFKICPEADGRVKISAYRRKTLSDRVYDILKNNGNPMHLSEIYAEFKRINPEHHYSDPVQLRPALLKHDSISYRNRKSIYVLKEWTHVKFGTIRSCVIEFLTRKKSPQTAKNITDYVLQYFPETNNASVRTSMLNDTRQRFAFFNDGFFGLSRKRYHSKYERTENSLMPFSLRLSNMEKFIAENGHFPFASSKNRYERILGVWWVRISKGIYAIDEGQQKEIERVKSQYAACDANKRTFQWNKNYCEMKSYILENHKMPSISKERFLYHWYSRFKTDFHENRLNGKQRQKYIELMKLIDAM
ncbi:MAG: hypothetical protein LBK58_07350 [Prevotellaceae bacterium]|jgi:hypothetical protein|nr:hypothetical protein [Prevotellaceae bacterium]